MGIQRKTGSGLLRGPTIPATLAVPLPLSSVPGTDSAVPAGTGSAVPVAASVPLPAASPSAGATSPANARTAATRSVRVRDARRHDASLQFLLEGGLPEAQLLYAPASAE